MGLVGWCLYRLGIMLNSDLLILRIILCETGSVGLLMQLDLGVGVCYSYLAFVGLLSLKVLMISYLSSRRVI